MAITPFVGVQWQPLDLIDEAKMDDMSNAIQFVHDNTPRVKVGVGSGAARSQGVKIAAGRVTFARNANKSEASASVDFGNFFSSGCIPLITTGVQSKVQQNIFCTFQGWNDRQAPDQRGMLINIEIGEQAGKSQSKNKIQRSFQVHWMAMGW